MQKSGKFVSKKVLEKHFSTKVFIVWNIFFQLAYSKIFTSFFSNFFGSFFVYVQNFQKAMHKSIKFGTYNFLVKNIILNTFLALRQFEVYFYFTPQQKFTPKLYSLRLINLPSHLFYPSM